jgi:hypothetical protein
VLKVVASRHICRFAPDARKKVMVPWSGLILGTICTLRHVIGTSDFAGVERLSRRFPRSLLERRRRQSCSKSFISRFLRLTRLSEPRHVLANLEALPFGVCQRPRSFFSGQTLAIGTRDALG